MVTDGEMRRLSFQSQMLEAIDGFAPVDLQAFLWGDWKGDTSVGNRSVPKPPSIGVVDRLVPRRSLSAEELTFLRATTQRLPKITLPSPGLFTSLWAPERAPAAYPTVDAYLRDVVDILRREVAELVRVGAEYIQLDGPHYPMLLDPAVRAAFEGLGRSPDQWLDQWVDLDNAVMQAAPSATFGLHLCRGNQESRWLTAGGYDAIAEPIFARTQADRLLLEYDDARSGSFEPLRRVADGTTVVLGLITTKSGGLEDREVLRRRVHEATAYVPLERLAISPQCGFASSVVGNRLSTEQQKAKLNRVREVADEVWP